MSVLLVQLPTSHLGAGEKVYPLGLARLAGLIPPTVEAWGLDMNLAVDPWPALKEKLTAYHPSLVAFSFRNIDPLAAHHSSYLFSLKTAAMLTRRLRPDVPIVAGGPAFSLFGQRLLAVVPELDAGLMGEGETAFPMLLAGKGAFAQVAGLIRRKGEAVVINTLGEKIDLATLPPINTALFPPEAYLKENRYVAAMGIEGKRGCDLHCSYCVYPALGGHAMRLRPPVAIVQEMQTLNERHGAQLFHFTDSVVNRPSEHFEAVCRELIRRRLPVSWTGFFREDHLTAAQADLALKAGLIAVYFSGDALTDHGLKILNKRLTKDHLRDAARVTAERGILTMCHFLANLPGEGPKEVREARETLDQLLDIHAPAGNLGAVIFNTVRLYPGAPLTRRLLRRGDLDPQTDLLYPTYYNPSISAQVLFELEAHCHAAGVMSRLAIPQ